MTKTPPRRTLLQRGFLAVASALGLASAGEAAPARSAGSDAQPHGRLASFRGRLRPAAPGSPPETRYLRCGTLFDVTSGERLGDHYATLLEAGPVPASLGGFGLELHTFRLPEGTLFGIGSSEGGSERTFAVLAGTGRFAGARGSYLERPVCASPCGKDEVEFVLNLNA